MLGSITLALLATGVILSLWFCWYNYRLGKRMPSGTEDMVDLAGKIREGANTFLKREFKISIWIILAVALLFVGLFHPFVSITFLLGATMSSLSAVIGMKAAVLFNEKVANRARLAVAEGLRREEAEGITGKVAIRGGAVMGFVVKGTVLAGFGIILIVFGKILGYAELDNMAELTSLFGIKYVMLPQILTCYALGCSTVAVFNRLGGGIFTKGADMAADMVGKTELGIPEDDRRNPATIADCVGDNVGDVAGNGSDLNESTAGANASAMALAISLALSLSLKAGIFESMLYFPIAVASVGLLACLAGVAFVLNPRRKSASVKKDLNFSLGGSAVIIAVVTLGLSYAFFGSQNGLSQISFVLGWASPWVAALLGIISGVLMGVFAECYTSADYRPTKQLAKLSEQGPAMVMTGGDALGDKSCAVYGIVFLITIVMSYAVAGFYGVAMAAVGMLSFVASTVTVDTYGPISDNAGGIAEMAMLDGSVRGITDSLDALGNTTAAVGKGFAIGSGAFSALSMMMTLIVAGMAVPTITDSLVIAGAILGGCVMFWLSGNMTDAVCKNASAMVSEIWRQFTGKDGKIKNLDAVVPDYNACIDLGTRNALKLMVTPSMVAMLIAAVGLLVGGVNLAAGIIVGAVIVAIPKAISTANSGGAWDNNKKAIHEQEAVLLQRLGAEKFRETYNAAISGDIVGDSRKDVVGPNQDIMIKLMATVAAVLRPVFSNFYLLMNFIK